jgi:hypothetical protein
MILILFWELLLDHAPIEKCKPNAIISVTSSKAPTPIARCWSGPELVYYLAVLKESSLSTSKRLRIVRLAMPKELIHDDDQ